MKNKVLFICMFFISFLAYSQNTTIKKDRKPLPDIHPNNRVEHPSKADNHHHRMRFEHRREDHKRDNKEKHNPDKKEMRERKESREPREHRERREHGARR